MDATQAKAISDFKPDEYDLTPIYEKIKEAAQKHEYSIAIKSKELYLTAREKFELQQQGYFVKESYEPEWERALNTFVPAHYVTEIFWKNPYANN